MKKIRMDIILIILMYLNLLVVFKVISSAYMINDFSYGYAALLFSLGAGIFLLYRHVLFKRSYRIIFTIAVICFLVMITIAQLNKIYSYFSVLQSNYNDIVIAAFNSTEISFVKFKEIFQLTVPTVTFIVLCIMACGFSNIIIFINAAFMITFWYINYKSSVKEALFIYVFSSSLTYAVSSYFKNLSIAKRKGIKNSLRSSEIIGTSCLICLFTAAIVIGLPKLQPGKYSSEIRKRVEDKFNGQQGEGKGSNKNAYGLVLSGYNDSSVQLGGPIEIDNTLDFRVKADKPVYLKGATKDYYDGFSWTKSDNKLMKMDPYELPPTQGLYTSTLCGSLKKLSIYPENLKVSTVFTPEYLFKFDSIKQNIYYDREYTYTVKKNIKTSYDIYYNEPKGDIGVLTDSIDGKAYEAMDAEYSYCSLEDKNVMSRYSRYLEVPPTVPPEVYQLVGQITNGYTTDGEKVQKICEYLKKNYKYSLAVSVVPDGREFVDYFLFNERQGYCTYFATAAAIMCRIAGVPSRYAEGFRMTNSVDGKGYYLVTNKEAHAWAEVLTGPETNVWSIIDCTPGEDLSHFNSMDTKRENENPDMNALNKIHNKNRDKDLSDNKRGSQNTSQSKIIPAWVKVCALISLLFLLYFIFTISIDYIRKDHIIRSKSVIPLYNFYIKKMKSIGYVIPENLSDMECAYKIDDKELRKRVVSIIECAYSERFGCKIVSGMDRREYLKFIKDYLHERKNK